MPTSRTLVASQYVVHAEDAFPVTFGAREYYQRGRPAEFAGDSLHLNPYASHVVHLGQNGIRDALKDAHIWSTMIPIQSLTYVRLVVPLFTFHTIV